jgi:hypothetical protein
VTTTHLVSEPMLVPAAGRAGRHSRRWARRDPLREAHYADHQRLLIVVASAAGLGSVVVALQGALVLLGL